MEAIITRDLAHITSDDIAPLEKLFLSRRYPDMLCEFARSLYLTLYVMHGQGKAPADLAKLALDLMLGLSQDFGGSQPYIPVCHFLNAAEKGEAIRREFNGTNYGALAAKYAVTESRVRQILTGRTGNSKRFPATTTGAPGRFIRKTS